jgi:ferredoxin--NADP+ reductase
MTAEALLHAAPPLDHPDAQTVTAVRHWDDRVFSFRATRPANLRFRAGEFTMIGLPGDDGRPILRAYSIASPVWDDEVEFYSIKVEDGPLTSRLQRIRPGDRVIVRRKPTGTLVLDALRPGARLWMLSTGTGVAPFASLARDPDVYAAFDRVILTHTCRRVGELAYSADLARRVAEDPLVGEHAGRFVRIASTTRESSPLMGRITTLIESGALFSALGAEGPDPASDRVMLCGSQAFNRDVKAMLEARGFMEGSNARPADFVLEKAFVG